ncbi:MAG: hypothetical protein Q4D14_00250 [Bacteroidales bacterium]|nr:hypothetical protein [Bacteroidales bacterium]
MKILRGSWMLATALLVLLLASCGKKEKEQTEAPADDGAPITEQLRFCESVFPYDGGLLVANFGTKSLDDPNSGGLGYITYYKNGKNSVLIPADGHLTQPRGMGVFQDHLFVCCLNAIVVYHLKDLSEEPQTILFPTEDLIVNDLVINDGGTLFASVSNTGRIYILAIQQPDNIDVNTLRRYAEIPGANGLCLDGRHLYVASYNPQGEPQEENVLYVFDDVANSADIRHLTGVVGQYDGLALSPDHMLLFFTDWSNGGQVGYLRFETGEITYLPSDGIVGPADLNIMGNELCVPDLVNSTVYRFLME